MCFVEVQVLKRLLEYGTYYLQFVAVELEIRQIVPLSREECAVRAGTEL